ncbi:MAG: thioredoxin [Proteobacteria bacterium]|nr:MAG: thioredoxin [Pseudomonadota bacterium]
MSELMLIRCTSCGTLNRVPPEKLAEGLKAKCGRCGSPISVADAQPVKVTDATFAREVESAALPVLVDAWAEWCGPCRMIAPVVDELAVEMAGRVKVTKLNVDENPMTASRFGLRSIPTLLVIKDGVEVDRLIGVQPKTEIVRRLQRFV